MSGQTSSRFNAIIPMVIAGAIVSLALNVVRSRNAKQTSAHVLKNKNGVEVHILPLGAVIQKLLLPNRHGVSHDCVLGFDSTEPYADGTSPYFGAIVGRVANRIAGGKFSIGGQNYQLAVNNGPNALHGGLKGWDKMEWKAERVHSMEGQSLRLTYESVDGEEGYPGTVRAQVTYTLKDVPDGMDTPCGGELVVVMEASTDKATPINMAQHTYFNLGGHNSGDVLGHLLQLPNADHYTPIDKTNIPTGDIATVRDTPFDFTTAKRIGDDIASVPPGYDHNYVLFGLGENAAETCVGGMASKTPATAAVVEHAGSGRRMEVLTTAPGMQLYTANWITNLRGKAGAVYNKHSGVCFETQGFPNAINTPNFPSVVLLPGQKYEHVLVLRFSTF